MCLITAGANIFQPLYILTHAWEFMDHTVLVRVKSVKKVFVNNDTRTVRCHTVHIVISTLQEQKFYFLTFMPPLELVIFSFCFRMAHGFPKKGSVLMKSYCQWEGVPTLDGGGGA